MTFRSRSSECSKLTISVILITVNEPAKKDFLAPQWMKLKPNRRTMLNLNRYWYQYFVFLTKQNHHLFGFKKKKAWSGPWYGAKFFYSKNCQDSLFLFTNKELQHLFWLIHRRNNSEIKKKSFFPRKREKWNASSTGEHGIGVDRAARQDN